jgi:hypothetical protein
MAIKLKFAKYIITIFLFTAVFCKKHKKTEPVKTDVEKEIVEPKVPFYQMIIEDDRKNDISLDSAKYQKLYIFQGGVGKLIGRELEDLQPSDLLSELEIERVKPGKLIFENYESQLMEMYDYNKTLYEKKKTKKIEILYVFTSPISAAPDKVLIGVEIKHMLHNKRLEEGYSIRIYVFEKINGIWKLIGEKKLK